jgi:hypothetical protein
MSQDYAQKPQRNFTFMNGLSRLQPKQKASFALPILCQRMNFTFEKRFNEAFP